MFFLSKKKKIERYLQTKDSAYSAFDELLQDYLNGTLKEELEKYGMTRIELYIDWHSDLLDNYRCIGIQGEYRRYFVDIEITKGQFIIACDEDEPDDPEEYVLETRSQMYSVLETTLKALA